MRRTVDVRGDALGPWLRRAALDARRLETVGGSSQHDELLHRVALVSDVRLHLPCPLASIAVGTVEHLGEELARDLLDLDAVDLLSIAR